MKDGILKFVLFPDCRHESFIVDETLNLIECSTCGKQLNPLWVVVKLSKKESTYKRHLAEIKLTAEKAVKKNRCKCQHCQKMTRIERE